MEAALKQHHALLIQHGLSEPLGRSSSCSVPSKEGGAVAAPAAAEGGGGSGGLVLWDIESAIIIIMKQ